MKRLPAEWEPQDAVMLTWPHQDSDWAPLLDAAEATYIEIAKAIMSSTKLIVVAPPHLIPSLQQTLGNMASRDRFAILPCPSDDTWARDHGPICVEDTQDGVVYDFIFNGWGNKFEAKRDNEINTALVAAGFLHGKHQREDFVLEGGALESDGKGTVLTTNACLLNPNRNPQLGQREIEAKLAACLGATHVLWLEHGHLVGDDTDSHIDTLARLAPNNQILYVRCHDPQDEHFIALNKMEGELNALKTKSGGSFSLNALPWPTAKYSADGHRLPATYANFLITNGLVLVPTYQDKQDELALKQIQKVFPEHKVMGIDCSVLIEQHGSLHCITMQIPKGFLNHTIFN